MNLAADTTTDASTLSVLLDTVRRFVRDRLVPAEHEVAEADAMPAALVDEMRALGLFGLSIPEKYGGLGLKMSEEAQVVFELAWTSPAFRSVVGTNVGIGSQGILMGGSEDQKRRYLPALASGELIGAFALTEPDAGSDVRSISTFARRGQGGYVINGTKRFITNAAEAGLFTLLAQTEADAPEPVISAFLVDAGVGGLRLGKPERKMGQQGAHVCDVVFEDCFVPESAILGEVPGRGLEMIHRVLMRGRLHLAAVCVGVADRLIHESVHYAATRRQFGSIIGDFQLVQAMLADSKAECYAARCMVVDAARNFDAGLGTPAISSCCKLFASEMAGRVSDRAVQIFGGAGYMTEFGIERFYRDVRLFRIYEGTSEIQRLIIGRDMISAVR